MSGKDIFIYPFVIEKSGEDVALYFPDIPGAAIIAADTVSGN
ncbi:hypothetical protein P7H15_04720 [Paenibacillus larvae]|nr:hypothetical protein [Paenibacillus larvae]MDT2292351.1 hypothetical protein [Paenibacillus larvae]